MTPCCLKGHPVIMSLYRHIILFYRTACSKVVFNLSYSGAIVENVLSCGQQDNVCVALKSAKLST